MYSSSCAFINGVKRVYSNYHLIGYHLSTCSLRNNYIRDAHYRQRNRRKKVHLRDDTLFLLYNPDKSPFDKKDNLLHNVCKRVPRRMSHTLCSKDTPRKGVHIRNSSFDILQILYLICTCCRMTCIRQHRILCMTIQHA